MTGFLFLFFWRMTLLGLLHLGFMIAAPPSVELPLKQVLDQYLAVAHRSTPRVRTEQYWLGTLPQPTVHHGDMV